MQLMLEHSDRCLVVVEGKIIADDNPVTILNQKDLLESANLKADLSLYFWVRNCQVISRSNPVLY